MVLGVEFSQSAVILLTDTWLCPENLYSILESSNLHFSVYMIFSLFLCLCSLLPACVQKYKTSMLLKSGLRPGVFAQVFFAYIMFLLGIPNIIVSSLTSGTIPVQELFDTHCCKHLWAESLFHWRSFSCFWVLVIQKVVYCDFTRWRYVTGHSAFHSGFFHLLSFYRHWHRYSMFFNFVFWEGSFDEEHQWLLWAGIWV